MLPHLLSSLLFGLSANADCVAVGLSYGIKKTAIGWSSNFLVGFICFSGTLLSMVLGKGVLLFLPEQFTRIIGSLIIILIGIIGMIRYLINKSSGESEEIPSAQLGMRESFLIGFALSVNNMALGVGAGITGLLVLPTAFCSFLFSLFFLSLGNRIGLSRLSAFIGRLAEPLANLLMICLGVYELFI